MLIGRGDTRRLSLGRPCPPTRGDEPEAAVIKAGERRSQPAGFVLSPAICPASHGRWPARRAGRLGAPAPGRSHPSGATPSRHGRGDRGAGTPPGAPLRYASTSTARWGNHRLGHLAAALPATAVVVDWSMWGDAPAPAWGPRPRRPLAARPPAIDTLRSLTPGPGVPPRVSSIRVAGVPQPGVAVVPRFWGIQRISYPVGDYRSFTYANLDNRYDVSSH
jgi:hypothetical protein